MDACNLVHIASMHIYGRTDLNSTQLQNVFNHCCEVVMLMDMLKKDTELVIISEKITREIVTKYIKSVYLQRSLNGN
jgi:hypothetical protein